MAAKDVALTRVPTARDWISRTVMNINSLNPLRTTMAVLNFQQWARNPATAPLRRHFHLDNSTSLGGLTIPQALGQILAVYSQLNSMLSRARSIFRDGPGDGHDAAYNNTPRDGYIYFTPRYVNNCGPLTQVYVIIHEGSHYLDESIQDYLRSPPRNFQDSLRNAYSFSEYTFEVVYGRRTRLDSD